MRLCFRVTLILMALGLTLQLVSCRLAPTDAERGLAIYPENIRGIPGIRVLVKDNLPHALLSVSGPYEIRAEPEDPQTPVLGTSSGPVTVKIQPTVKGFVLGAQDDPRAHAPYGRICLRPLEGSRVKVDGIDYGGEVILVRRLLTAGDTEVPRLRVVIRVNMERYLVGVVPHEMYAHWPVEALRAQCVASRSYAFYKIRTRTRLDFDVMNTTASQVWRPAAKDNPVINLVVNTTAGQVMTDNWRLFPAYFCAQCGGETKDGADVFISRHILPLTAVSCPHCSPAKQGARAWTYAVPLATIQSHLHTAGYPVGPISRIRALDQYGRQMESVGRVYDMAITHSGNGRILTLPAMTFRRCLGAGKKALASTFFAVTLSAGQASFTGRGDGHGVGMCQYGARTLAEQNKGYSEILSYYYRGHKLVKLWGD